MISMAGEPQPPFPSFVCVLQHGHKLCQQRWGGVDIVHEQPGPLTLGCLHMFCHCRELLVPSAMNSEHHQCPLIGGAGDTQSVHTTHADACTCTCMWAYTHLHTQPFMLSIIIVSYISYTYPSPIGEHHKFSEPHKIHFMHFFEIVHISLKWCVFPLRWD